MLLAAAFILLAGAPPATPPRKGEPVIYPAPPSHPAAPRRTIPFVPLIPQTPTTAGLPGCSPANLEASVSLQGAGGSMLGGFELTNTGSAPCLLHGPPRLVLTGATGRRLPLRRADGGAGWSLTGLRIVRLDPGRTASAWLRLDNACDPPPGARLHVVLAAGEGQIDLGIGPEGTCLYPSGPPGYTVGNFDPGQPPLTREQRAQQRALRITRIELPRAAPRGATLRFSLVVENTARAPVTARTCPFFYVQLWLYPHVVFTRQYVLDCVTLGGALRPHAAFRLELSVPIPLQAQSGAHLQVGLETFPSTLPARVPLQAALNGPGLPEPYTWVDARLTIGR